MNKKVIKWALRIVCFVLILAAVITVLRCLPHINDDYSEEALMGDLLYPETFAPAETDNGAEAQETAQPVVEEPTETPEVPAEPAVILTADGAATAENPYVMVTAAFENLGDGIVANLSWFVDGELVFEDTDRELTDGDTVSYSVAVDTSGDSFEDMGVSLTVEYDGYFLDAAVLVGMEHLDDEVIRTQEIVVTALRDSEIYGDQNLSTPLGAIMEQNTTGLLRDFGTSDSGQEGLQLQFADGSEGWVAAEDMEITDEDCTADADYTQEQKETFINSMHYSSSNSYLVWVNLYTQKVNIFSGSEDNWMLEKVFSCSSGVNTSPTTTGLFEIASIADRWDLGSTYVAPVMVFNGGQAFTSQPYDAGTGQVADDTMGKPSSGGGVRLLAEDIAWMAENIPVGTMVVVY